MNSLLPSKLKRDEFLLSYRPQQNWSLPDSIIYYISKKNTKNQKVYQKLIQSCKYFFIHNPIIVIKDLYFNETKEVIFSLNDDCGRRIDMANVSSKFWITDTINIYDEIDVAPNRLSSIIPKVYQANITKLNLKNQIISYSDFLFLSSNVENIDMFCTTVKAGNDSIVPLEKLVNGLPKIKSLWFFDNSSASSITTTTFKKLLENPHFFKCAEIVMQNLPEKFDIETFFSYAKKNQTTKIFLHFNDSTSEAYKTRLETFIDLVVASQTHNYLPPLIHSPRIDDERWQKITSLYHTY